jgi:polysaccharide biosynthesis/export protein
VRVARAFRLPIIAAMIALALPGCMRRTASVAVAPQPSLDTIAYAGPAPVPIA